MVILIKQRYAYQVLSLVIKHNSDFKNVTTVSKFVKEVLLNMDTLAHLLLLGEEKRMLAY